MAKQKIRISKPLPVGDGYVIQVREGISPIAPVAYEVKFHSMSEAQTAYRHMMIEHGFWV